MPLSQWPRPHHPHSHASHTHMEYDNWILISMAANANKYTNHQSYGTTMWGCLHATMDLKNIKNTFKTMYSSFRYAYRTSIWMLRVLERSHDQRHMGPKLYISHRCETVQRMLRKYFISGVIRNVWTYSLCLLRI